MILEDAPSGYGKPSTPIEKLADIKNIVIILCHGGYFSGAVFEGKKVIIHKTFHHYVTRKKQGGRQSSRDKTGKRPKSGGASIRRYNEQKHLNEIRDLFAKWKQYLNNADLIFTHIPGRNRGDFFNDEDTPNYTTSKLVKTSKGCYYFHKDDERIRPLPFTTQRPTYKEVKQVFVKLTTVNVTTKEDVISSNPLDESTSDIEEEFLLMNSSLRSSSDFVFGEEEDEEEEEEESDGEEEDEE